MIVFIVLAVVFQKRGESSEAPYVPPNFVLTVEDIPETKQVQMPPPPKMPAVPVEAEEVADVMDEVVFEVETLTFYDIPEMPEMDVGSAGVAIGARPMLESFPQYPESELEKGHEGIIDLRLYVDEKGNVTEVKIIKNTTNSKVLANLVIKAALESKYQSARDRKNNPIATWTSRTYSFKVKGD